MSYTIIILIIYVAAQLIAYLAKKAAERKEQERIRMEMERRRNQRGAASPVPQEVQVSAEAGWGIPGGPANPLPVPTPIRTGKPVDDLAARRKQQLDQLRQRREGLRTGGTGSGSSASAPPTRRGIPDLAGYDHLARQEAERREQEQARDKRERDKREGQKRDAARNRRDTAKREQLKREQAKLDQARRTADRLADDIASQSADPRDRPAPSKAVVRTAPQSSSAAATALRSQLINPVALRELFVLKELIDPPLSLRPDSQSGMV